MGGVPAGKLECWSPAQLHSCLPLSTAIPCPSITCLPGGQRGGVCGGGVPPPAGALGGAHACEGDRGESQVQALEQRIVPAPLLLSHGSSRHLHLTHLPQRAFDEHILGPALRYSASTPLAFLRLVLPQGVSHLPGCGWGGLAASWPTPLL